MRANVVRIRFTDSEMAVIKEFATRFTMNNQAQALRYMVHAFGRSANILSDKEILELEQPRHTKSPVPANR